MKAMYNELVGYNTTAGTGDSIIPDAAASMPTITNAGKTYTFKLRHNIHFWNGKLATSADWKYSFERIINPATQAGASSFWSNVAGAAAYAKGKAKHVSGFRPLESSACASTLRLQTRLSERACHAVWGRGGSGANSALRQVLRCAAPDGHGSLHVQAARSGAAPNSGEESPLLGWQRGSRSHDRSQLWRGSEYELLRTQRGQADIAGDGIPSAEFLNTIHDAKYKHQIAKQVQVALTYIPLNTLIKPFNNKLVRQAVNYAINKPLLVRIISGRGVVTNTFLPPNMPGYGNFNLYPYNPAKARALLAKAGYAHGFSTTFYSDDIGDDRESRRPSFRCCSM
jgi:ABC-type transport system substrate-binding protein